jgi:hypothetical protein
VKRVVLAALIEEGVTAVLLISKSLKFMKD